MKNCDIKPIPLYKKIREILSREILEGLYPVGSCLPTEQELCKRFNMGRHTIREALRGLQEAGFISRKAGLGSIILSTSENEAYTQKIDSLESLWQYAQATRFDKETEVTIVLRSKLAKVMGRKEGERWLRMAGFRCSDDNDNMPLCWSEIFVPENWIGVKEHLKDNNMPVYLALSKYYDLQIEQVERYITAIAMPSNVAKKLGVKPDTPALMERRSYLDSLGNTIEISISIYPGDCFAHSYRLTRETAPQ